ncbi:MAG TPA: acyltransferase [Pirellulales bacterium]|nr:acyltransferase [Pirellulales bacterium]
MSTVALEGVAARPVVRAEAGVRSRILLIDALRAVAATTIAWHHFAQYWPLSESSQPVLGNAFSWLNNHARAAQVFFVIGGFVMARSMAHRHWNGVKVGSFIAYRYCRLGLPYLAVILLAIGACAVGRGLLSDELIGPPPTLPQVLAHTVFLQDILGYGSLSAGLWFVCINFQLGLVYALMLWMRDSLSYRLSVPSNVWWVDVPLTVGMILSVASLFFFNLDERWSVWCVYFFSEFFLGILAQLAIQSESGRKWFSWYILLMAAAIAFQWRWRLVTSLGVALLLYFSESRGIRQRWSTSGMINKVGRMSYSLFLIHFPVFLIVASLWIRLEWDSPSQTVCGLAIAFAASLIAAAGFYRLVEESASRFSRRFA